jgi:hypothetical protein
MDGAQMRRVRPTPAVRDSRLRLGVAAARRCDGTIVAVGEQLVVEGVMMPMPLTYTEESHGPHIHR